MERNQERKASGKAVVEARRGVWLGQGDGMKFGSRAQPWNPAHLPSPPTPTAGTRTAVVLSWSKRMGQSPRGQETLGGLRVSQTSQDQLISC